MAGPLTLDELRRGFRYRKDSGAGTGWRIMWDGLSGDCEDFALTALMVVCGWSSWRFWAWQITGRACIWLARTEAGESHAMLWVRGHGWIDNIHPDFSETPRHRRVFPVIAPLVAVLMLSNARTPGNRK